MTIVYLGSLFEEHDTGAGHPESARRIEKVNKDLLSTVAPAIKSDGGFGDITVGSIIPAERTLIEKVHQSGQVDKVMNITANGGGFIDGDTVLSSDSYHTAAAAVGVCIDAVDQIVDQKHHNALCLIRPPGHHATADTSMGFCLFNNIAIAAEYALKNKQLGRVLIIDWDVHHGNGTQDIFYGKEDVFYFSTHRYPFYPGSGHESETGTGSGLGKTLNIPMAADISRSDFLDQFQLGLDQAFVKCHPDLVMISAGFDAHYLDPVGSLGLETEDFGLMTEMVIDRARQYCAGRILSVLEGGYHPGALYQSIALHLQKLSVYKPS